MTGPTDRPSSRWHRVHFLLLATIVVTLELTIGSNPERLDRYHTHTMPHNLPLHDNHDIVWNCDIIVHICTSPCLWQSSSLGFGSEVWQFALPAVSYSWFRKGWKGWWWHGVFERRLLQFIRARAFSITLGISVFVSELLKLTVLKASPSILSSLGSTISAMLFRFWKIQCFSTLHVLECRIFALSQVEGFLANRVETYGTSCVTQAFVVFLLPHLDLDVAFASVLCLLLDRSAFARILALECLGSAYKKRGELFYLFQYESNENRLHLEQVQQSLRTSAASRNQDCAKWEPWPIAQYTRPTVHERKVRQTEASETKNA